MDYKLLSLVPPLLTIFLALLTRRVGLALFTGVLGGAFVLSGYQFLPFLQHLFRD